LLIYDTSQKSFLSKVNFKSHLRKKTVDVAYMLAQGFTLDSQLSQIERVLYLNGFFANREL